MCQKTLFRLVVIVDRVTNQFENKNKGIHKVQILHTQIQKKTDRTEFIQTMKKRKKTV